MRDARHTFTCTHTVCVASGPSLPRYTLLIVLGWKTLEGLGPRLQYVYIALTADSRIAMYTHAVCGKLQIQSYTNRGQV